MSNTSATGGYLLPSSSLTPPGGLTLIQFLQTVLVGVSGFKGNLVRPKWQQKPPPKPDENTDWLAFQVQNITQDTNAYVGMDANDNTNLVRNEQFEISVTMYGPGALENTLSLCDSLQITQNQESLLAANMAFVESTQVLHGPELVNEVWYDRYDFSLVFRRQMQRVYAILPFVSASGSLKVIVNSELETIPWQTQEES